MNLSLNCRQNVEVESASVAVGRVTRRKDPKPVTAASITACAGPVKTEEETGGPVGADPMQGMQSTILGQQQQQLQQQLQLLQQTEFHEVPLAFCKWNSRTSFIRAQGGSGEFQCGGMLECIFDRLPSLEEESALNSVGLAGTLSAIPGNALGGAAAPEGATSAFRIRSIRVTFDTMIWCRQLEEMTGNPLMNIPNSINAIEGCRLNLTADPWILARSVDHVKSVCLRC